MKKIALISVIFVGCADNSSTYTPSQSSSNGFEHNYVKNRMKIEGYSDKDSETAAKAIMKFHNAQKKK